MTLFQLKGVTRVFDTRKVLDIEALAVEEGKIHAVLGPNGAGKTTLLHLLALLDRPSTGVLSYLGKPVRYAHPQLQALRREVVMVEQFPIMFTTSVWRNLEFGLKIRGFSRSRRAAMIEEALEMVGMYKLATAPAHRLSGGETQRVALARALALSPRVFLCDEPTANVDVENQAVIVDILRRINGEKGITVIFASHDHSQAARLAHRTLVLDHGRMVTSPFENVFAGRILSREATRIRVGLGGVELLLPATENISSRLEEVRVSIDARMISLQDQPSAGSDIRNTYQGEVLALSLETKHVRVVTDVGIGLNILLPVNSYQRMPLTVGQRVSVTIPAEAVQPLE
jgi:tungstate transport system ATP-binding protein